MPRFDQRRPAGLAAFLLPLVLAACQDPELEPAATAPVVTPLPQLTIAVTPSEIRVGETAQIRWTAQDASSCLAANAWSGTRAAAGAETVTPAAVGTYEYRMGCSGAGGSIERSALLQVFPLPPPPPVEPGDDVALVLAANPTEIPLGLKVLLSWSAIHAEACTASGAWTGARAVSGELLLQPESTGSFSYTLQCNGAGAPAVATVTVTVTAAPPPAEDFAAAQAEFQRLRNLEQSLSTP